MLEVVKSWYPGTDTEQVAGGFNPTTSDPQVEQLRQDVEPAAETLAGDLDLFPEIV